MKKIVPFDAADMFIFASLVLIFVGLYMLLPPIAYVVTGLILLALGLAMVRAKSVSRGDDG